MNDEKVERDAGSIQDIRFNEIYNRLVDTNIFLDDLNNIMKSKVDNLVGAGADDPADGDIKPESIPECWVSRVLSQQDLTRDTCNEIMERLDRI